MPSSHRCRRDVPEEARRGPGRPSIWGRAIGQLTHGAFGSTLTGSGTPDCSGAHQRRDRSAHARKGLGRRWLWSAMCTRVGRGSRHGGRRVTPTYLCATSICPARGRLVAAARCSLLLSDSSCRFSLSKLLVIRPVRQGGAHRRAVCRLRHNVPALRARVRVRCLSIRVRVCERESR
eukprot:6621808-Prymnesium_polylepis.1